MIKSPFPCTVNRVAQASGALLLCALAWASPLAGQGARALRFGILPDATSLPLLVAAERGMYTAEGILVELSLFSSALERDAAFQAGAVDGVIADTIAAALAVQGGFQIRIVTATDGRYGLVSAPGTPREPAALKGKTIGLSVNTIIQYVADSALARAGLGKGDVTRSAVPKIPIRLELLLGGQIAAVGLPEPFLSVAIARGAGLVASSDDLGIDAGVILFAKPFLDSRNAEVSALLKAYWKAAQAINAKPDDFRALLVEKAGFPVEIRDSFRFLRYRKPALPALSSIEDTLSWMRETGLLKTGVAPSALIDERPLRGW